jgi:hypothetical protein
VSVTLVPVADNLKALTCATWRLHNSCFDHSHPSVLFSKYLLEHSCSNIDGLGDISTFLTPHNVAAVTGRLQTDLQTVTTEGHYLFFVAQVTAFTYVKIKLGRSDVSALSTLLHFFFYQPIRM